MSVWGHGDPIPCQIVSSVKPSERHTLVRTAYSQFSALWGTETMSEELRRSEHDEEERMERDCSYWSWSSPRSVLGAIQAGEVTPMGSGQRAMRSV